MEDILGTAWKIWLLGGGAVGIVGWFLKLRWDNQQNASKLKAHEDRCEVRYNEITHKFDRMNDKMDKTNVGVSRCNEQLAELTGYLRAKESK